MSSIEEKAVRFQWLHDGPGAFIIPNPWDVGSARVLVGLGFKALATVKSAGQFSFLDRCITTLELMNRMGI